MKNVEKHLVGWLSICLLLCSFPVWAQGDAGDYLTIVGMVKDKQNKKALENVNVSYLFIRTHTHLAILYLFSA